MEVRPTMELRSRFPMKLKYNPSYVDVYDWEHFDFPNSQRLMEENWMVGVYLGLIYLILIYLGRFWMDSRPPFKLARPLLFWNIALAGFSIVGFLRTFPEFWHIVSGQNGLHRTICSRDEYNITTVFWSWMMTLSKVVELGDTAFIVLRKQRLIFLHWYHHLTVMLFAAYTYESFDSCNRWFVVMNFGVHSIMYSYYALKALGVKLPKGIPMIITSLQVLQMVFGVCVNIYTLRVKAEGVECGRLHQNIYLSMGMYFTYLLLFVHFFRKSYFQKSKSE